MTPADAFVRDLALLLDKHNVRAMYARPELNDSAHIVVIDGDGVELIESLFCHAGAVEATLPQLPGRRPRNFSASRTG